MQYVPDVRLFHKVETLLVADGNEHANFLRSHVRDVTDGMFTVRALELTSAHDEDR
jgi:hypothetical protein